MPIRRVKAAEPSDSIVTFSTPSCCAQRNMTKASLTLRQITSSTPSAMKSSCSSS